MPTLEWMGKAKVIAHHQDVPYRVLEHVCDYGTKSESSKDGHSENMIIHGDNLEALKSLLPKFEGKVDVVYIDPPYNTGNEGWIYNDNVNDPRILKWIGEVVGKEGEDFTRHDKWLCMMYPRIKLLQKLLSPEGAIFISIDDNELYNLKEICDEIFGARNYLTLITRPTGTHTGVVNKAIVGESDYILVYAKNIDFFNLDGLPMTDEDAKIYDMEDERGRFLIRPLRRTGGENRREDRPNMYFPVEAPDGTLVYPIGPTGYESRWICNPEGYEHFKSEGRIYWKKIPSKEGIKWQVYQKFYLENKTKAVSNLWDDIEGNKKATREVRAIFSDGTAQFDFPKPVELIERIIQMAPNKDAIILDSFAGSGTTGHAVLRANNADGGTRKFILIELMDYAETITSKRMEHVIDGYGLGKKKVAGTGGSFGFYELGDPLFLDGYLNPAVAIDHIREYIWYTETNSNYDREQPDNAYLLGTEAGVAYYFCYEPDRAVALNSEILRTIQEKADRYIIYADTCELSQAALDKYNVVFKKIPRDITHF